MTPGSIRTVLAILMAANFVVGMGAFSVIGLLIPVADDFAITDAAAGWMLTSYALGYALLSSVLVALTGRIGRRRILAFGFGVFALAALICALAPSPGVLFAARVLSAAGAGLVTPVSASVAAGLATDAHRAKALALVFTGMTLAQVIGVPFSNWLAYVVGWRSAFALVVVLAAPTLWLIWTRVPSGLAHTPVALGDLTRILRNGRQMLVVSFTVVFIGAIYIPYSYIGPLLAENMGFGRDGITLALMIFGIGAVVGNFTGGIVTDRIGPQRTLIVVCSAQILIMPVFAVLPLPDWAVMALLVLWATFGFSFMAAQQSRLIAIDPAQAPVFLALNAAGIYVGAAFGAAIGGAIITHAGLGALGPAGGAAAVLSLAVLVAADRMLARPLRRV